jgi:truncated hemoglobin YjbI
VNEVEPPAARDFDRAGGEAVVRAVVDRFVRKMAGDFVIGFFFEGRDLDRIIAHEYEHAAIALGAGVAYTGRPIAPTHRALKINAGHFRRRLALLRAEIDAAGLPGEVRDRWLDHQRALEATITDGTDCGPGAP